MLWIEIENHPGRAILKKLIFRLFDPSAEAAAYLEDYCDYKLQTQCMENEIEVVEPMEEMNLDGEDLTKFQVEHDSDGGCDLEDEYECLKYVYIRKHPQCF